MSNLRLLEPRLLEPRLFDTALSDSFDAMFRRFMAPTRMELEGASLDMRVDVTEANGAYKVRADIPGVKKEDISVRIDGNIIQIDAQASKQKELPGDGAKVLRHERWDGAVSRTFSVTQDVDDTKATAKYEDGVLILDLPKKATSATKRISIH